MGKMKTHRGAAKRFKTTGTGKILRRKAFRAHLLEKKSTRRTRRLGREAEVTGGDKKRVERFLAEGSKVKLTIMFRGREMAHPELGRRILERVADRVGELAIVEAAPRQDGRNMTMVLNPTRRPKGKGQGATKGATKSGDGAAAESAPEVAPEIAPAESGPDATPAQASA